MTSALLAFAGFTVTTLPAAAINPFTVAYEKNDNGAISLIGNNLLTCPASDSRCAGARAGTSRLNNNSFPMVPLDADGVAGTVNSSSAWFTVPPGGSVLFAGLYWGARLSAGSPATTPPPPRPR